MPRSGRLLLRSRVADELRRVGANLFAVEHMKYPQSFDELAAESLERQMHELAAETAKSTVTRGGLTGRIIALDMLLNNLNLT